MPPVSRTPAISLHALQRARTTLEDFCSSYAPLHGQDVLACTFRSLDVLVFTSSLLYELDEANEGFCRPPCVSEEAASRRIDEGVALLRDALSELGLLSERAEAELASGVAFWRLERKLCGQLNLGERLDEAEVLAAHKSKSFDYRVLHHVLCALLQEPPDEALFAFCSVDERLVDVGDDLTDYEEDVESGCFNLWRCLLALAREAHGPGREASEVASRRLFDLIAELESTHQQLLLQLPAELQRLHRERHAAASAVPRSEKWVLPPAIHDEAAWRRRTDAARDG